MDEKKTMIERLDEHIDSLERLKQTGTRLDQIELNYRKLQRMICMAGMTGAVLAIIGAVVLALVSP